MTIGIDLGDARFARLDPKILQPIADRTVQQQEALTLIRARDLMVRLRTAAGFCGGTYTSMVERKIILGRLLRQDHSGLISEARQPTDLSD
jgi:hypothetical protein